MARKPETAHPTPPEKPDRDKIVEAFMALLAEHAYEKIGFAEVATRAGVPLHRCRAEFDTLIDVLAAHLRQIDSAVLAGADADMAQEPPRERLFDVLMRRLELLAPHKAAVRSLARSARCNPPLALALNALSVRSQRWMLTAADIDSTGLRGAVRAQGLALLYVDVLRAWVKDDDPGLARTMAVLDRQLARGARWLRNLDDLRRMVPNPCKLRRRFSHRRREDDAGEQPATV